MKCDCGFKFSGPGEFRNCDMFINEKKQEVIVCPNCKKEYTKEK